MYVASLAAHADPFSCEPHASIKKKAVWAARLLAYSYKIDIVSYRATSLTYSYIPIATEVQ